MTSTLKAGRGPGTMFTVEGTAEVYTEKYTINVAEAASQPIVPTEFLIEVHVNEITSPMKGIQRPFKETFPDKDYDQVRALYFRSRDGSPLEQFDEKVAKI